MPDSITIKYRQKGEMKSLEFDSGRDFHPDIKLPERDAIVDLTAYPVIVVFGGRRAWDRAQQMRERAPHAVIIAVDSGALGANSWIDWPTGFNTSRVAVSLTEMEQRRDEREKELQDVIECLEKRYPAFSFRSVPTCDLPSITMEYNGKRRHNVVSVSDAEEHIQKVWPECALL